MRGLSRLWLFIKDYYFWPLFLLSLFSLSLLKNSDAASRFYSSCVKIWAHLGLPTLLVSLTMFIIIIFMWVFLNPSAITLVTKILNFYNILLNYVRTYTRSMLVFIQVNYKQIIFTCWGFFIYVFVINLCPLLEELFFKYGLNVYFNNLSILLAQKLFGCRTPKEVEDFYWWVSVFILIVNVLIAVAALIYIYNDFKNKP